ncbi:MAG TPA: hypothetical protein VJK07_00615 [Candidatus Nanoarchaeia archaeon]|nr:hypothetical protein [Candidatus Nanoarchaeia archaeon]
MTNEKTATITARLLQRAEAIRFEPADYVISVPHPVRTEHYLVRLDSDLMGLNSGEQTERIAQIANDLQKAVRAGERDVSALIEFEVTYKAVYSDSQLGERNPGSAR